MGFMIGRIPPIVSLFKRPVARLERSNSRAYTTRRKYRQAFMAQSDFFLASLDENYLLPADVDKE